uniref:Uncharacterized protein n=1 Tax=Physcomitrium patens TaxID=3218 RepID=A0A7I4EJX7_PHYPA
MTSTPAMAYIEMVRSPALEMGTYLLTAWTATCNSPEANSTWDWIKVILFSPCCQHVLISSLHLVFVALLALYSITRLVAVRQTRSSSVQQNGVGKTSPSEIHISSIYRIQVACIALVMLFQWFVAIWRVIHAARYGWFHVPAHELVFSLSQALAWSVFAAIVCRQKRFCATLHSKLLRAWWIMTFLLSLLALYTSIVRYLNHDPRDVHLWIDDIVSIGMFPVVVLLVLVAMVGRTGISVEDSDLFESLVGFDASIPEDGAVAGVTEFASASFISKAMWLWLNPLLKRGNSKVLELKDIPLLAPEDRAELLYSKFIVNFESQPAPASVRTALLQTFWPQILFTAFLSVSKLSVMYVGPILITQFVSNVAGNELFSCEGLVLVVILFAAKLVEVLSAHHFNFYTQKLGMVVRSSLITAMYRKGLRLSSFSRQTHSAVQIARYMSVDAQRISDLMLQIHHLWALPLQVAVGLIILHAVIGISCLGGILMIFFILFLSFNLAKFHRGYQGNIMRLKNIRMTITTEVLNNMKILKLQAWEDIFKRKIEEIRNSERKWLAKFMYVLAINVFLLWLSPIAFSTATFALCVLLKVPLTSAKVFTAISTFRIMQEPLRLFPQALVTISQAIDSFDRLDNYMCSGEVDPSAVEELPLGGKFDVEIENGNFKWDPASDRPTLKDVNVKVKHGTFVAIVGMVGSGKSAVLSAVLGEMTKLSGSVKVRGRTAYVGQSAWIENATIKDNILFGRELDKARYEETIRTCSLTQDLARMNLGDETEVVDRGIHLPIDLKQRIQLARAVYQDADVYVLDDVFSSIDAHNSSVLFKECIMGALGKKTVLLVTHQMEFLRGADLILVLRNGEIVQSGKYNELSEAGTDFQTLLAAQKEVKVVFEMKEREEALVVVDCTTLSKQTSHNAELTKSPSTEKNLDKKALGGSGRMIIKTLHLKHDSKTVFRKAKASFIDDEQRATGQVSLGVDLLHAMKAFKGFHVFVLLVLQTCWQGLQIASDYWLAHSTAYPTNFQPAQFITMYFELVFGSGFFILLMSLFTAFAGLMTAQSFFDSLLNCIMRAPMAFFDRTPSGRILSRVTWQMIFVIVPLAYVYVLLQRYYVATSRELTRIDGTTKASIIVHFSDTISGLATIRAFCQQPRFATVNMERVDASLRTAFHNNAANEWLGFHLEMIGTVVLATSALFMVTVGRNFIDPELVGLSLSYGLALNGYLYGIAYLAFQLENNMVSVERINKYCGITSEAPPVIEDSRPAENWPTQGSIQFHRLQLRYDVDTPLVLKDVSFNIKGGEKVGVVGSGKSSLIQALFRLVEPSNGCIMIDKLDTRQIGLKDLRTKFGIIPQDPTLFEGTVRSNIDPMHEHTDPEIWEVLEKCQLAETIKVKNDKLDSVVVENGDNWSVGQRQLLWLGRALLKKAKILVLDEPTTVLDTLTDSIMQDIIRAEFAKSTVITIARRIPRVMDADKVLVFDSGVLKEFDAPSRLLEQPDSLFAAVIREYSEHSKCEE